MKEKEKKGIIKMLYRWKDDFVTKQKKAIGVFDSGLGGISVLRELRRYMPNENYIYYGDSAYAPYGEKSKEQIKERCEWICSFFIMQGVKAIVIACNTATSACVEDLRSRYPDILIIGMEPALKLAVDRKVDQHVRVLATKFTLGEEKFHNLASRFENQHTIEHVACPKLVTLVEQDQLSQQELVKSILSTYLEGWQKLDSIVLGCTHFVYYRNIIQEMTNHNVQIIDGNVGTTKHLHQLLTQNNLLHPQLNEGSVHIYNSSGNNDLLTLSRKLLESTMGL